MSDVIELKKLVKSLQQASSDKVCSIRHHSPIPIPFTLIFSLIFVLLFLLSMRDRCAGYVLDWLGDDRYLAGVEEGGEDH